MQVVVAAAPFTCAQVCMYRGSGVLVAPDMHLSCLHTRHNAAYCLKGWLQPDSSGILLQLRDFRSTLCSGGVGWVPWLRGSTPGGLCLTNELLWGVECRQVLRHGASLY
jgi:hypothetical protein